MFNTIKKLWMRFWMIPYYSVIVYGFYYVFTITSLSMIPPSAMTSAPTMNMYEFIDIRVHRNHNLDEELEIYSMASGMHEPSVADEIPYVYGIMRLPARRDAAAINLAYDAYMVIEEARLAAIFDEKEIVCLATNMYHEARSEGRTGMLGVGWVTLNRRDSASFPDSVCKVVYQPSQFSWANGGSRPRMSDRNARDAAFDAARFLYTNHNDLVDFTEGAQYFHTPAVSPSWSRRFELVYNDSGHIYYRDNRITSVSTKG